LAFFSCAGLSFLALSPCFCFFSGNIYLARGAG
jgi:hypothetical protein